MQNEKNQIDIFDCLVVIILALITNIFSEFFSWLLLYRTKRYKEAKKKIDSLSKKIENAKDSLIGKNKVQEKKIKDRENDLKDNNFEMMKVSKFLILLG